jgi:hypothetical protein
VPDGQWSTLPNNTATCYLPLAVLHAKRAKLPNNAAKCYLPHTKLHAKRPELSDDSRHNM